MDVLVVCCSIETQKRVARELATQAEHERAVAARAQLLAYRKAARDLANAHMADFHRLREVARHREER